MGEKDEMDALSDPHPFPHPLEWQTHIKSDAQSNGVKQNYSEIEHSAQAVNTDNPCNSICKPQKQRNLSTLVAPNLFQGLPGSH